MSERPSDNLQPVSKRRAGDQITKDNFDRDESEGEEEPDLGWRPADADTIKNRKRVHVRRRGVDAEPAGTTGGAAATNNPFAGISLAAPTGNPFAGVSILPGGATTQTAAASAGSLTATATSTQAVAESIEERCDNGPEDKIVSDTASAPPVAAQQTDEDKDSAAKPPSASQPLTFSFGTQSQSPFAALSSSAKQFGGGFGSVGGGFGGVGGGFGNIAAASAQPTGDESSALKPAAFPAGNGGFQFHTVQGSTHPEGAAGESLQLFCKTDSPAAASLPVEKKVTGEEDETTVFSVDGVLYEFDQPNSKWRERGRGEFRVNSNTLGQARMLMRQAGNLRLLLNAKVYVGMPVQKMTGNSGVTFGCMNIAPVAVATPQASGAGVDTEAETGAGSKSSEKKQDAETPVVQAATSGVAGTTPKMATWAIKVKSPEKVDTLFDVLERHKNAGQGAGTLV